jgi:hypothetical protein
MAHDVFISYASSDKAVADAVCSQLESIHRIRCWIAPRDVTPGASWAESIIDALDGSKIMVLIFSSSANASMQIEREVERAVHKGINIIPLRIENAMPTKTLEYFISAPHWLDALTTPLEDHINKLAQSVKALLTKQGALASHAPALAAAAAAAKVQPAIAVPVQPATAPAPAPAAKAAQKQSWAIPAAIAAGVVIGAAVFGARFMSSSEADVPRTATPSAAETTPPAPVAPVVQAPAGQPPPAAAPTPSAAATATPAAATTTPPPGTPTGVAAAAVVASKTEPNLFIDFRNTLEEGTMTLDIDGQTKWTTKLGTGLKPDGKENPRFEDLRTSISIPTGRHKVTATLRTPEGKVRDTDSTAITVPEGAPRTLRVRLSRFRHHVEFQEVAGKPAAPAKPGASTQKPTSAATTAKPAPATSKTAPAK